MYAKVGPELGPRVAATNTLESGGHSAESNVKAGYSLFDAGVHAGGGAGLTKDRFTFFGEFGHTLGLLDITKDSGSVKNRTFGLSGGVTYNLSGAPRVRS